MKSAAIYFLFFEFVLIFLLFDFIILMGKKCEKKRHSSIFDSLKSLFADLNSAIYLVLI